MSKGLFSKLAVTNIKNNKQFYVPYLLTGILTVGMFYIMCALAGNKGIEHMSGARDLQMILNLGIGVIGIFSVIFLFYTNSFIIKRRKKELGIYSILGMEKKHIAGILFRETLFTMLISVGGGLVTGIVFNKLLTMLLCAMMKFETQIKFYVSTSGILWTAILFVGIYLLTYIYDLLQIKLANPIELLQGGHTGEKEPKTKAIMAILGVICLGAGYYIAITTKNPLQALTLFFVAVILVIVGTYLLFTAGSIALLKILRKNKRYYYQTKHFTSVSGMIYRMKQNAVGLSNICILSTMVLVVVSTTVSLYVGVNDVLKQRFPRDISIYGYYEGTEVPEENSIVPVVEQAVKESGRKMRNQVSYLELDFAALRKGDAYVMDAKDPSVLAMEDMTTFSILTREGCEKRYDVKIPELADNEIVLITFDNTKMEKLVLNDRSFTVTDIKKFEKDADTSAMLDVVENFYYVIVNDVEDMERICQLQNEAYAQAGSTITYNYQLDIDGTKEEKEECFQKIQENINQITDPAISHIYCEGRESSRDEFYHLYGGFLFLGLFLGAMFLMITVLIIFYKQISEGYDDRERFAIMEKVGMSNAEVKATIRSQILMVFFCPILMAAIHVAAAFPMIKRLLVLFNLSNTTLFAGCMIGTILVFAFIYLLVFLQTQKTYYRIVGEQVNS